MADKLIYAKHNNARISPKKVAVVMDLVRGKSAEDAERILTFDPTKAAKLLLKVLKSAVANAETNNNLKASDLYLAEVRVDAGRTLKRGRWSGRGRYSRIFKRASNLIIGLGTKEQK